jgi:hypothetical protein
MADPRSLSELREMWERFNKVCLPRENNLSDDTRAVWDALEWMLDSETPDEVVTDYLLELELDEKADGR